MSLPAKFSIKTNFSSGVKSELNHSRSFFSINMNARACRWQLIITFASQKFWPLQRKFSSVWTSSCCFFFAQKQLLSSIRLCFRIQDEKKSDESKNNILTLLFIARAESVRQKHKQTLAGQQNCIQHFVQGCCGFLIEFWLLSSEWSEGARKINYFVKQTSQFVRIICMSGIIAD